MHFLRNYSMYNNEIWQCVNILVHNPVKQTINVRIITVIVSKYIKNLHPKRKKKFKQFRPAFLKLWSADHLWSWRSALVVLKKNTEQKLKFKLIAYHTKNENLRVFKWFTAIAFHFSPSTDILLILLPYPYTDCSLYSQQ